MLLFVNFTLFLLDFMIFHVKLTKTNVSIMEEDKQAVLRYFYVILR